MMIFSIWVNSILEFLFFSGVFFCSGVIWFVKESKEIIEKHASTSITTKRVFHIRKNSIFSSKMTTTQINLDKVAHIHIRYLPYSLEIFEKPLSGGTYYYGKETSIISRPSLSSRLIMINLDYKKKPKKKVMKEVVDILIKSIPLIQHSKFRDIYYSEK